MITIPEKEIKFKFARSSGAGGQNVNRRATCVQLRWHVMSSGSLNNEQKQLIIQKLGTRMNQDGELCLEESSQRTQERNRALIVGRLNKIVNQALVVPKKRKATKPSGTQKEKRLQEKRKKSEKKQARKKVEY